jgi:hypothetical protein
MVNIYKGNKNLKSTGVDLNWTEEQVQEYVKCADDPIYFIKKYVKIIHVDHGLINFKLWPWQEEMVKTIVDNRFTICKIPRQSGKTATVCAVIVWYVLFNEYFKVGLLANKFVQSKEILARVQLIYENLPLWMQQGVDGWGKGHVILENGSEILAASTSSSAIRGMTFSLIYLDEFAHVPLHLQDDFFASTYPVITSGQTTKIVITSTPKGLNLFYSIWKKAEEGLNQFKTIEAHWSQVPGRNEEWAKKTKEDIGERRFNEEFNTDFIGSSLTLISPSVLINLPSIKPLQKNEDIAIWKEPIPNHIYVTCVDTCRGVGGDYHAFIIVDVTTAPYEIVYRFKNNTISTLLYPTYVYKASKHYNNSEVLVESNDVGQQVADIIYHDIEYENLFMTQMKTKAGGQIVTGFGGGKTNLGVRMTKSVKSIGCLNLKTLVEDQKLIINDIAIIEELHTFIEQGQSYAADDGYHDDLAMCLHRNNILETEDGPKTIKWICDNKYFGKVLSYDHNNNKFVYKNIVAHSIKENKNKKWVTLELNNQSTGRKKLKCTTDHLCCVFDDIMKPKLYYLEAENTLNKYSVQYPYHDDKSNYQNSNVLYNEEQIYVLLGILAGDGNIHRKSNQFSVAHSYKQEEYIKYKSEIFNRNFYTSNKNHTLILPVTEQTKFLKNITYINGKKSIKNILKYMNEISLAFWFMDDGHLKKLYKGNKNHSSVLCTDSFSYEDHLEIQKWLFKKFEINSTITKIYDKRTKKDYFRINFGTEDTKKLSKLIYPYVCKSMEYKLVPEFRNFNKKLINNELLKFSAHKITKILDVNRKGNESKLYDIEVEEVHNFVANKTLVHNCLVLFGWLTNQQYFKDWSNLSIRAKMLAERQQAIEDDLVPFGIINNSVIDHDPIITVSPNNFERTLWELDHEKEFSNVFEKDKLLEEHWNNLFK